jgi:hypothetical protein
MMVAFMSRRDSTPAPPKSLKLFGIMRHIGSVHAPRQPPSRLRVTAAPAAHLRNVGQDAMLVKAWKT